MVKIGFRLLFFVNLEDIKHVYSIKKSRYFFTFFVLSSVKKTKPVKRRDIDNI